MENFQDNVNMPWKLAGDAIKQTINCVPLCFHFLYDEYLDIKHSNKILMPKFLLNELSVYDNLKYPLTLKIKDTILGVHEISEDIDGIYIPNSICEKIQLHEPCMLEIEVLNTEFPKATFLKLKPYSSEFYNIKNTKEFLENGLKKNYTHIEENAIIELVYQNTVLKFDVIETQPKGLISLNETNVEVDFEKSHDYKEPEPEPKPKRQFKFKLKEHTHKDQGFVSFSGKGNKLGGN